MLALFERDDSVSSSLEDVFQAVNQQITQLSHRWHIFRQLYDSGQESIDLLNRSGSIVFGLLQKLLIDDAILIISRLTDPGGSSSQENASVANLLNRARVILNTTDRDKFEKRLGAIRANVKSLRTHRNKAIAHADLEHAASEKALPPLTYDEIENAMTDLCKLMADIARTLFGWTMHHNVIIRFGQGGDTLLRVLARAHENAPKEGYPS